MTVKKDGAPCEMKGSGACYSTEWRFRTNHTNTPAPVETINNTMQDTDVFS